jgi:hypothetical protein
MRWGTVMIAALAALAAGMPAQAIEPDFTPPEGFLHSQDFAGVHGIPTPWQAALGSWQADGQTYNSISPASSAVTTLFEYRPVSPIGEITSELQLGNYSFRARLRNEHGGANTLVGLVYLYHDPSMYDEVVFSPTGIASLRRVTGGNVQTVAVATYAGGGQGVWFSVELKRVGATTSVSVNGVPVFTNAPWEQLISAGQVGFSTYDTTAKFNKVSISVPWGQQPFTEDFADGVANGFSSGTFVVSNGTYASTAVQSTNEVFAPIDFGVQSTMVLGYTLRVRMLNPYGGAGNLVGISFDHRVIDSQPAYDEVVFSPTGVAQLRHVVGHTFNVVKSASHSVGRNAWFEVVLVHRGSDVSVSMNGEPLFTREGLPQSAFFAQALALVTHWSPGKFDDFSFNLDQLTPSLETFDTPLAQGEVRSGTWNTQGGTLNSVAAGIADIVVLEGPSARSDYRFKGRLLNQYGASGNLVGLVFSYNSAEDYLEAVFSPTGQAQLNLHIEGTRYRLATGTHGVPRNVWFDAELIRQGTTATVTVNGAPVMQNVQAGHIGAGGLGVVTHWAKGSFDNISTRHAAP